MSTVEPTDKLLIQRGDTLYSSPVDMSTAQDTDLIIVNRAGVDYKCTIADLKAAVGSGGGSLPAGAFSWDPNAGTYNRLAVKDRDISVQSRMRRCVMNNSGQVQYYLDSYDSTKRAGNWLRIVETTTLDVEYTGTHGIEQYNSLLRAGVPAWAGESYPKGQRVTYQGNVWEALTTVAALPENGATAANLTGPDQVMVEIPRFSVWHEVDSSLRHKAAIKLGTKTDSGYQVHPAFIRPDGTYREYIYIGAYTIGGASANQSTSGVTTGPGVSRFQLLTNCMGRGAGWRTMGFWDYNALQWLYLTEYQDLDSQKMLGNGATSGAGNQATTGLSNSRGNRCGHATNSYVSYRGIENIYGRNWQFLDGINVHDTTVYLCSDPAKWQTSGSTGYTMAGSIPAASSLTAISDFGAGLTLLPSVVTATGGSSLAVDGCVTSTGWCSMAMGGGGGTFVSAGIFCVATSYPATFADQAVTGRLCYAP